MKSERVVTSSPMSFTGSARRILNLTRWLPLQLTLGIVLIVLAWSVVLVWNTVAWTIFGFWTLIYRHARRSARREKVARLQHRELLDAQRKAAA